jgi:DNA-directed RNA polymerase subunit RPC12/RpoP
VFTCPNPSCRKVFAAPLKTLNLQYDSKERYNACPYCLTKIEEGTMTKESTSEEDVFKELQINEGNVEAKRKSESNGKQPICNYHLGYLSERAQNEQIPEECLVCQNTVECMLRKMRQ